MLNDSQIAMFNDAEEDIRHRVNMAMRSQEIKPVQSFVLHTMDSEDAFGLHKAVSIQRLQYLWDQSIARRAPSDRVIKDAVKALVEKFDIPIGSSRSPGRSGYYYIQTDADAEEASRPLRNEIFSMFRRLKVISPKSLFVRQLQGQMELLKEE